LFDPRRPMSQRMSGSGNFDRSDKARDRDNVGDE
jgi:hypothetical protein